MESKSGIIKTIAQKPCKNGSILFTFELEDNNKYNTFDSEIGLKFKPGDAIEMTGEREGQFWNMKTMNLISVKAEKLADNGSNKANSSCNTRDEMIIAQTLTKCFSEIVASNPALNTAGTRQSILETYKFFLSNL